MSINNRYPAEYDLDPLTRIGNEPSPSKEEVLAQLDRITRETEGRKYDQDKPDYSLMPSHAEEEIVRVLTFGAKKYDRENWRKVPDAKNRYYAAARRHIEAWRRGEELDKETGVTHLAHAACCLLFLMELDIEN